MHEARNEAVLKVLMTGGGTGGHINPGLAVISEIKRLRPDTEFLWVGTRDRLESELVPRAGIPIEYIEVSFIKGRGLLGKLRALARIPRALWQSGKLVKRFRPDVVVGVGGFAAGPVTLASALRRVPTAILEQNARPGLTNRLLGKVTKRVFIAFDEAARWFGKKKVRLLGNPVRPELLESSSGPRVPESPSPTCVLVLGGSQGAASLNHHLPGILLAVREEGVPLRVRHSAGRGRVEEVEEAYGGAPDVEVLEYIDDMRAAYDWADFAISRAGASTVAELTAVGKPAMYVPFPAAADDHQAKNALAVVTRDGGVMVRDHELSEAPPVELLAALLSDRERIAAMGRAAKQLARPSAAADIAAEIVALAEGGEQL